MTDAARPFPRCLYVETARPAIATPPLGGTVRADVAIVGGGITGLSTALHLAEQGISAVVLDANEPGSGASGRNGGQVNPGLYPSPEAIEADFGRDLGRRMFDHAATAPDRLFALVRRLSIDCAAEQTGTLRVAFDAKGATAVRATMEEWHARGARARWMDVPSLGAATGTARYHGGILFPNGGRLNPLSYVRGLAQAAVARGAQVYGESRVARVRRGSDHAWTVETAAGRVEAEHLVIAGNGYTDGLWPGLRESIVPVQSAIVATEPLKPALAARVMPSRSVLYEVGHVTTYWRLDEHNRLLMGGRSRMADIGRPEEARHLVAYAERLFPDLHGVRWTHGWNGRVAITRDRHIHFHEPAENVHIVVGYNGRGIAMATAMGALLARRIEGAAPEELPMPITALAGMPLHGLWRPAVSLRILYGRIRDALGI